MNQGAPRSTEKVDFRTERETTRGRAPFSVRKIRSRFDNSVKDDRIERFRKPPLPSQRSTSLRGTDPAEGRRRCVVMVRTAGQASDPEPACRQTNASFGSVDAGI